MAKIKVLILRGPGTNCDVETAFAFELVGAQVDSAHINEVVRRGKFLSGYQILAIPGGFTYGDDISAGKILANEVRLKLADAVGKFIAEGKLVLGICNGFQVMVKAGILPHLNDSSRHCLTLAPNDSGKFECRWVYLRVNEESPCIFTKGIRSMYLPVAHAEGKVVIEPEMRENLNVVLWYADERGNIEAGYPHNPNGSFGNIAGICDESGRLFALLPHPERHIQGIHHPRWTRDKLKGYGDGFQIFLNAVKWVEGI